MRNTMLGNVAQFSPDVVVGDDQEVQMTKLGQVFTANWKERLLMAGRLWVVTIGTFSGDADITLITGGGNGTTVDLDNPEAVIGVDEGYYLIPVECHVSAVATLTLDAEYGRIILCADRTLAPPAASACASSTTEVPLNLLDGGPAFPGVAYSAITGTITDPTNEELLCTVSTIACVSVSVLGATNPLTMHYEPTVPDILKGACSISLYWGGTAAVTGVARVVVGVVPLSWFPTS